MSITPRPSSSRSPLSSGKGQSLEESQDIFASTSSEGEDSEINKTIDLSISSDSETDETLKTQKPESTEKEKSTPIKSSSNDGSPVKATTKSRQRTLLEMLDQSYNQTGPATKKHCTSKTSQQK